MTTLSDCDIYLTKSGEGIRYCPLGTLPPAGGGEDPAEDLALRGPLRRTPIPGEKTGNGNLFLEGKEGLAFPIL